MGSPHHPGIGPDKPWVIVRRLGWQLQTKVPAWLSLVAPIERLRFSLSNLLIPCINRFVFAGQRCESERFFIRLLSNI
jgi:hypothetical protein